MIDAILNMTSDDAANYFRVRPWRATASTWFRKVAAALRWQHDNTESDAMRQLLAEEAARLLYDVLSDAWRLVPLLRDDTMHDLEMVERETKALLKALRNHRVAAMLDNTTGRTPEEASAFVKKAEDMRR